MRIALANLRYPESPDESVALVVDAIRSAADLGAEIICFPECYVPGYRAEGKNLPKPNQGFLERAWAVIAEAAGKAGITVLVGTERIVDDRLLISVLVVNADGSVAGFQDKVQVAPEEEPFISAGTGRLVFRSGDTVCGIVICHEGWRYPETVREAVRLGAQIVFHPHFGEYEPGGFIPTEFADPRNTMHEKAMICRAAENTCYFASVNCASPNSPTTSAVIDPDGNVICYQPYGQEGLLIADLDLSRATRLLASRLKT